MSHLELVVKNAPARRSATGRGRQDQEDACAVTYARRRLLNTLGLAMGDASALLLSIFGAAIVNFLLTGTGVLPDWIWALIPAAWLAGGLLRLFPGWDLVRIVEMRRTLSMIALVFGSTAAVLFLSAFDSAASRNILAIGFLLASCLVPLGREQARRTLRRAGKWGVPTVIVGAGSTGRAVNALLTRERGLGYVAKAFLDDNPRFWGRTIDGIRVLGATDHVTPHAAVAILAMPWIPSGRRRDLLGGPLARYRKVFVIPGGYVPPAPWIAPHPATGVLGDEIGSNLADPVVQWCKRAFDFTAAILTAIVWLPLLGIFAFLIRLETGACPFVRRTRSGRDGESIKICRLRTTVANPEEVLRRALEDDPALQSEWETTYRLRRDPRISRVGRLLRRTSLDKLPQMLDVLRGKMSIIGPSPLPDHQLAAISDAARSARMRARPGIIGLRALAGAHGSGSVLPDAGASGHDPPSADEARSLSGMDRGNRIEDPGFAESYGWDAYYVANWSTWLDVVVLIRTFLARLGRA